MPSFSNPTPATPGSKPIDEVFSTAAVQQVLKDRHDAISKRAREVLMVDIPGKIATLQRYLDERNDPSSLLWPGHRQQGPFVRAELVRAKTHERPVAVDLAVDDEGAGDEPDGHECVGGCGCGSDASQADVAESDVDDQAYEGMPGVTWTGGLPQNKLMSDLLPIIERESSDVIGLCRDLEAYIQLCVPVIEDGNNFGVDVQQAMLEKVQKVMSYARQALSLPRSHYADRMKLAMTWCRYPNLDDHASAITASDRLDHFLIRESLSQLSIKLTDLLHALSLNWSKVHAPKGGSGMADGMY